MTILQDLALSAEQLDDEIEQVLALVELALLHTSPSDDELRNDLQDIRTAALEAIRKTKVLGSKTSEVTPPVHKLVFR